MRTGKPSRTSSLVAMLRALADGGLTDVRDFSDPTALELLPGGWKTFARFMLWRTRKSPAYRERVLKGADGRIDLVPLRTRYLDEAWHAAHDRGARQLILLGAGLDGRAFRLHDVGDTAVFEVDHPSTQALKRQRSSSLRSKAGRHVFVPMDFQKDRLETALETAGHSLSVPSFWIWEGVTPYLTYDAQRATLSAVAKRSAPGSRIAITYIVANDKGRPAASERMVRMMGEPFVGKLTHDAASALLSDCGFSIVEDTTPTDWRASYSARPAKATDVVGERIVLGERI